MKDKKEYYTTMGNNKWPREYEIHSSNDSETWKLIKIILIFALATLAIGFFLIA
jgi:hypothetical protein